MKFAHLYVLAAIIAVGLAIPNAMVAEGKGQTHYLVFTLGTLGGNTAAANAINNDGWVMGAANVTGNTAEEAVLWLSGKTIKLGTLGGPNSSVEWEAVKNDKGMIVGISDTSIDQPRGEIWSCGLAFFYPNVSGKTCQGFLWQEGTMTALPTLGGDNGVATGINNLGQVVGWAETDDVDSTCVPPQVLQFEGYVYSVKSKQITALTPYSGDPDSAATAINQKGQIVGISGLCSNAVGGASAIHAVLWQNGSSAPIDLGNIGGQAWNTPTSINNEGDVVGFANLSGDQNAGYDPGAFLWTPSSGVMQNLGTLAQDTNSVAFAINDQGLIVGQSYGPNGSHAFVYESGIMTDMNSLVIGLPSVLSLVYANDVNDSGVIVGGAYNSKTGESPAFVAIPY
jgi:probable HAF family extracellular repeat protein